MTITINEKGMIKIPEKIRAMPKNRRNNGDWDRMEKDNSFTFYQPGRFYYQNGRKAKKWNHDSFSSRDQDYLENVIDNCAN